MAERAAPTAPVVLARSAALLAATAGAVAGIWTLVAPLLAPFLAGGRPAPHESAAAADLLSAAAGAVLLTVALWLAGEVALTAAEGLLGLRLPRPPGPARLRRWLLLGCGLALAAGTASPAVAGDRPAGDHPPGNRPAGEVLHGLPLPDRPAGGAHSAQVRVSPGDCLWSLTRSLLPARAGVPAVARAWPRLYRANRDRIGPDPDLVHPGLVLDLPPSLARPARPDRRDPR